MISNINSQATSQSTSSERKIGFYSDNKAGPTLVAFGGMHGNEPSGVLALKKVFQELNEHQPNFEGKFFGIACNLGALSLNKRFINADLNRIWTSENLKEISDQSNANLSSPEQFEQFEIYHLIQDILAEASGPLFFIDLHTTSSESQPFISINDTLRNRELGLRYPLPIILGVEEHLGGTILNYINDLGHIAIGFEGGQHDAPSSIENHEAFIWTTLINIGCLSRFGIPNGHIYEERLAKTTTDGQKIFEVRHKYTIGPDEQFVMKPHYVNFQSIKKNELLASNEAGNIHAAEKGKIFMPLYQGQGDEGYFIIRKIRWFWLKVSVVLRKTSFHKILPYLPGINRHQGLHHALEVNKRIARWYVTEIFHLLGFRKTELKDKHILFIKRKYDFKGPDVKKS
ncbi:succinylglutamate desuccinylase/aspartoacylase family protein [Fulvivirgaceae bacterium BMA12]|uniref:Succinylglutamate desuccinylase/aspartoacylase family protein n=1 Tax=Agaribacillus aureus TaxID=3051825 RepID=A0ABT8LHA2_9BACT|nr:succinylglutamate desuccinylase/aspartoacylase family protein [Fulvivirgaceae bacterium BMA12]